MRCKCNNTPSLIILMIWSSWMRRLQYRRFLYLLLQCIIYGWVHRLGDIYTRRQRVVSPDDPPSSHWSGYSNQISTIKWVQFKKNCTHFLYSVLLSALQIRAVPPRWPDEHGTSRSQDIAPVPFPNRTDSGNDHKQKPFSSPEFSITHRPYPVDMVKYKMQHKVGQIFFHPQSQSF